MAYHDPVEMKKGNAKLITTEILNSDGSGPDLNNATEILLSISDTQASARHFQKTMTDAVITDGTQTGNKVSFTILPADVADLDAGEFYAELRYTIGGLPYSPWERVLILSESNND